MNVPISNAEALLKRSRQDVERANQISSAVSVLLSFQAPYGVLLNPRVSAEDGLALVKRHNDNIDAKIEELMKLMPRGKSDNSDR